MDDAQLTELKRIVIEIGRLRQKVQVLAPSEVARLYLVDAVDDLKEAVRDLSHVVAIEDKNG